MHVKWITIHCSDSSWGSRREIDLWHKQRGFREIGYHYVILNGKIKPDIYLESLDGAIEIGRWWTPRKEMEQNEIGAHVRGYNNGNIGICLIGRGDFTTRQFMALKNLVDDLLAITGLEPQQVKGHNFFNPHKECPCFNWEKWRKDNYGI